MFKTLATYPPTAGAVLKGLCTHQIHFYGRSFSEYLQLFHLSTEEMAQRGVRVVMDCPGANGETTFRLNELGFAGSFAVDTEYGEETLSAADRGAHLAMLLKSASESQTIVTDKVAALREAGSSLSYVRDWEAILAERLQGQARFAQDYTTHPERYQKRDILALGLEPESVDLTLCGNLLFLYDGFFDFDKSVQALHELMRVTKSEIRLSPITTTKGDIHPFVTRLIDDAKVRFSGWAVQLITRKAEPGYAYQNTFVPCENNGVLVFTRTV